MRLVTLFQNILMKLDNYNDSFNLLKLKVKRMVGREAIIHYTWKVFVVLAQTLWGFNLKSEVFFQWRFNSISCHVTSWPFLNCEIVINYEFVFYCLLLNIYFPFNKTNYQLMLLLDTFHIIFHRLGNFAKAFRSH